MILMTTTTIACIGSGNMGFALMKGIAGTARGAAKIGFSDADGEKAKAAAAALGAAVFGSNAEAAEKGDYIFLAVKPQTLEEVLAEIAPVIRKRQAPVPAPVPVLVSMAAGWTIGRIQTVIGGAAKIPVIRIMPNTPALVSKGMIALAASDEAPKEKIAALETMLKGAGEVDRIQENYLNAVTGLSGSGPAFVCLFIEALADGGVLAGLPRDKALRYAAQTVLGAAAMVQETGKHPGELKDMVASPSGTTIAGISALEAGAFRSTVIEAVQAAWQRAAELG
jgi:pyrroline-5-carboxylate reductase